MATHPPLLPTGTSIPLLDMSAPTTPHAPPSVTSALVRPPPPTFNHARHTTYWLRCARTFLPTAYESGDASRMLFAFFIVSALDLLGLLDDVVNADVDAKGLKKERGKALTGTKITAEEKAGWVDWVYHCQHLDGGFRGFTGTILGMREERKGTARERRNEWDLANLPATFFALCVLLILGDDLGRVERVQCLGWVKRLQREDGSFGEVLSSGDHIEGGRDLRFCCCAAGIMYILRDTNADDASMLFDEAAMVSYIRSCQSYEGGFSEGPFREGHSGLNYCAVSALSFLSALDNRGGESDRLVGLGERYSGEIDLDACVKWMLLRQTTYIEDDEEGESESDADLNDDETHHDTHPTRLLTKPPKESGTGSTALYHAGFNGRTNKIADTCYAFWNVGALAILGKQDLIDTVHLQAYLLEKVQHPIGGFGKGVGEPPDVLHAYLGLATLGLLGGDGGGLEVVKRVEPTLCVSRGVAGRVAGLRWKRKG